MVQLAPGTTPPLRLQRLQELQEGLFRQITLLLPGFDGSEHWVSQIGSKPALHLQMLEHHPYTSFLHLTYCFEQAEQTDAIAEPRAHIRVYHDLRVAEVTAFDNLQGIQRLAGPELRPKAVYQYQWRANRALHRWLDYLLDQGHSSDTMHPANPRQIKMLKETYTEQLQADQQLKVKTA